MFDKMLDKYFAKKLADKIEISFLIYRIDKKFFYKNHSLTLYIKDKKWNDKNYVLCFSMNYKQCFQYVINETCYSKLLEHIKNVINEYIEK